MCSLITYPEKIPKELYILCKDYVDITKDLCDCAFINSDINSCINDEELEDLSGKLQSISDRYKGTE